MFDTILKIVFKYNHVNNYGKEIQMTVNKLPLKVVVDNIEKTNTSIYELEEQLWAKLKEFNTACEKFNQAIKQIKEDNNGKSS